MERVGGHNCAGSWSQHRQNAGVTHIPRSSHVWRNCIRLRLGGKWRVSPAAIVSKCVVMNGKSKRCPGLGRSRRQDLQVCASAAAEASFDPTGETSRPSPSPPALPISSSACLNSPQESRQLPWALNNRLEQHSVQRLALYARLLYSLFRTTRRHPPQYTHSQPPTPSVPSLASAFPTFPHQSHGRTCSATWPSCSSCPSRRSYRKPA